MDNKKLNSTLKSSAIQLGLCDEWQKAWQDNATQQELISKYLRGIDFCLQHEWPSNKFIVDNFNRVLLRKNGMIVNDKWSLLNPKIAVVLGNSRCTVRFNSIHPGVVYARGNSNTRVVIHTNEKVIIHAFDRVHIAVIVDEGYTPDVLVLKHNATAHIDAPESVRQKDDFNYLA